MKKIYIKPNTELVKVQLTSGVLEEDVIVGPASEYSHISLGKEQGDFFDMEGDDLGDIWGDGGGATANPYDLWGEN